MSDTFDKSKYFAKGMINSIGNNVTGGFNMADYSPPSVRSLMGLQSGETGFGTAPLVPEGMQSIYDTGQTAGTIASLIPVGVGVAKVGATVAKPIINSFRASKPLTEAQGITNLIKSAHAAEDINALEAPIMDKYKNIFDKFGEHNVYEKADLSRQLPLQDMSAAIDQASIESPKFKLGYNDIDSSQLDNIYSKELMAKHNAYTEDPSLHNAHDLRMQLDKELRGLNTENLKGNLDVADLANDKRDIYGTAKKLLENDMNKFMKAKDPKLARLYERTNADYQKNIAPKKDVADILNASDSGKAEDVLNVLERAGEDSGYKLPSYLREDMGSIKKLIGQHEKGAEKSMMLRHAGIGLGGLAGLTGASGYAINSLKNILGD